MARTDLIKRVDELSTELGVEADTENKTAAELRSMIAELEGTRPPAPKPPPVVNGNEDQAYLGGPPKLRSADNPIPTHPYEIAPGKSLTCKRGVLGPGQEIRECDVSGGKDQLEHLVKRGHVLKGLPAKK